MESAHGRGLASTKAAQCLSAPKNYSVSGQVKVLMISRSGQWPDYIGLEGSGKHFCFILGDMGSHWRIASQLVT